MKALWTCLAGALLLATAALAQTATWSAGEWSADVVRPSRGAQLHLSGNARGLYPGSNQALPVRIRNPIARDVVVTSIRARARDAGRGCRAGNVRIRRRELHLVIPARSISRARMRIGMRPRAANRCQGARFPLRFHARVRAAP